MSENLFWILLIVALVLLLSLLFSSVGSFLRTLAPNRRKKIINTFSPGAIRLYFKMFAPAVDSTAAESAGLTELFAARFGLRRYVVPSVLLLGLAGLSLALALHTGLLLAFRTVDPDFGVGPIMPPLGAAAVAGAYTWVTVELHDRLRAADLSSHDLLGAALRFAIAIPFAYAFTQFVDDAIAFAIAVFLGAFPTRTLMTMGRQLTRKRLALDATTPQPEPRLSLLQGIDRGIEERFAAENISTITQLAYADVIDLTIRMGYEFTYIVDCASQALAWIYLEERLAKLRVHGLRGAHEIGNLVEALDSQDGGVSRSVIMQIAKALELDNEVVEHMFREIHGDPYTEFLRNIWLPEEEEEE